jgi:hypothetical protein
MIGAIIPAGTATLQGLPLLPILGLMDWKLLEPGADRPSGNASDQPRDWS